MRNLKKTLAVVLAFVMVLGMGAISTFAYTDVTEGTTTAEAVSILSGLEIITGFEDGTFRPEETVTRAQMAAIICRTLGYESQAESSKGVTVFNDVAADHWASGYVNVAQAQGIINGYGDGNFGPEDKVTYEQAVKMIVSALGYDIAATAKGGYPTGYLAIASAEGITKGANGRVGDAAARGTIAVLVYNSLEVRLMDQSHWDTDGTGTYQRDNKNFLTNNLDIVKVEGTVVGNALTKVAGKTYKAGEDPFVTIDGDAWVFGAEASYEGYRPYEKKPLTSTEALEKNNTFDASLVDVNGLIGKNVIGYIGKDAVTGKFTVKAIAESKNKNDSLKISAGQLAQDHDKAKDANKVLYKELGSTKVEELDLDITNVYVNYAQDNSIDTTLEIYDAVKKGGMVEFISNDGDSKYEIVLITAYKDEAVVEDVEESNGVYAFEFFDTDAKYGKLDTEDEDKLYVVYKDGVAATMADIAANDTISYVEIAKNFVVLYASSATVTGAVEAIDDENNLVTINGTDYEISNASEIEIKKLLGEEGTFFLNVDGQLAHNETATIGGGKYAIIVGAYTERDVNYLDVILADGTVASYKVKKGAKVYNDKKSEIDDDAYDYYTSTIKLSKKFDDGSFGATKTDLETKSALVAKLAASNGRISSVTLLPDGSDTEDHTEEYDAEAMSLGSIDVEEATIFFSLSFDKDGLVEPEETVIGTAADFLTDGEKLVTGAKIVAYDEDDSIYGVVLGFGLKRAIDPSSDAFIVMSKKVKDINDINAYVLTGLMAGEEVTVTVYDETEGYSTNPANVQVGDVLLLAAADAEGIVSDIYRLATVDYDATTKKVNEAAPIKAFAASKADKDDDIFAGYGEAKMVTDSKTKFFIDAAIKLEKEGAFDTEKFAANDELSFRSSANYTVVDFSENKKAPEISVESGNKWLLDGYKSFAYVRYVDDKLAEVVVYRIAEEA